MQTFLPYPDFEQSAQVLDRKRLGKQRVEVLQILRALAGISHGWKNHPAVKMWRGHERALVRYGLTMCLRWVNLGYRDTCTQKIASMAELFPEHASELPPWFGDPVFHRSHRSNLLRKDPEFYGKLWPKTPKKLSYVWPSTNEIKEL